jgi:hypothetical protein
MVTTIVNRRIKRTSAMSEGANAERDRAEL